MASWVFLVGCVSPHPAPTLSPGPNACEAPPNTLCRFLGLQGIVEHCGDKTEHVIALAEQHVPALAPVAPVKSMTNPELAQSPSDSVRSASQVAQKKAQVPQIKAALASVADAGCACDPASEQALLAGLNNCFPEVRLAAAEAIRASVIQGENCCDGKACCSPAIRNQLFVMGWERRPNGCPIEPVGKVRLAARHALRACGCPLPEDVPPPAISAERPSPEIIQEAMAE
ncbi:MAG: hypothetical protein KDA84_22890 [Planctomycetaceae bacterium]|nr:hypothetical protein [Planctomycetaceae bacterium]